MSTETTIPMDHLQSVSPIYGPGVFYGWTILLLSIAVNELRVMLYTPHTKLPPYPIGNAAKPIAAITDVTLLGALLYPILALKQHSRILMLISTSRPLTPDDYARLRPTVDASTTVLFNYWMLLAIGHCIFHFVWRKTWGEHRSMLMHWMPGWKWKRGLNHIVFWMTALGLFVGFLIRENISPLGNDLRRDDTEISKSSSYVLYSVSMTLGFAAVKFIRPLMDLDFIKIFEEFPSVFFPRWFYVQALLMLSSSKDISLVITLKAPETTYSVWEPVQTAALVTAGCALLCRVFQFILARGQQAQLEV